MRKMVYVSGLLVVLCVCASLKAQTTREVALAEVNALDLKMANTSMKIGDLNVELNALQQEIQDNEDRIDGITGSPPPELMQAIYDAQLEAAAKFQQGIIERDQANDIYDTAQLFRDLAWIDFQAEHYDSCVENCTFGQLECDDADTEACVGWGEATDGRNYAFQAASLLDEAEMYP